MTMGFSTPASYWALAQLSKTGIIRQITGKKRNHVWAGAEIIEELKSPDIGVPKTLAAMRCMQAAFVE